jgi:hypothetical protein
MRARDSSASRRIIQRGPSIPPMNSRRNQSSPRSHQRAVGTLEDPEGPSHAPPTYFRLLLGSIRRTGHTYWRSEELRHGLPTRACTSKEQIIKHEPLRAQRTRSQVTARPSSSEEQQGNAATRTRAQWNHLQTSEPPLAPKDHRRLISQLPAP